MFVGSNVSNVSINWVKTMKRVRKTKYNDTLMKTQYVRHNIERIGGLTLFYNKHIQIGSKSFFLKSWFDAGIIMVGDILNTNGEFLALDEFMVEYSLKTNSLICQGVINAV